MNTLKNWTREQRQRKSEEAVSVSIVFFLFFLSIIPLGYRIPSVTGRPFSPGYLPVVDGTRTNNILRTRLPVEYQSFRGRTLVRYVFADS